MVDVRAVGLLATIVAAWPAPAVAQREAEAERVAARLGEADRLERQGMAAVGAGNEPSAPIPLEAALTIREQTLGPDHADTVRVRNNLGLVCLTLGRPAEAEALLIRALASLERSLGPDHPDVADGLHNLAAAYIASDDARRIERSLPLFDRAAAIRARALGAEHPRVAESLHSMATVDLTLASRAGAWRMPDLLAGIRPTPAASVRPKLAREAYLTDAEGGFGRALAIREKALGPDHRDVAASLRGLATVQIERGRYAMAEPLMRRSLAISEKALGPDHPALAPALDDYAGVLVNARKGAAAYAEAKALKARARAIRDAQVRRASADSPRDTTPAR